MEKPDKSNYDHTLIVPPKTKLEIFHFQGRAVSKKKFLNYTATKGQSSIKGTSFLGGPRAYFPRQLLKTRF